MSASLSTIGIITIYLVKLHCNVIAYLFFLSDIVNGPTKSYNMTSKGLLGVGVTVDNGLLRNPDLFN